MISIIQRVSKTKVFVDNKVYSSTQSGYLIVSQFTLCGDLKTERRPSFINAKDSVEAEKLYFNFIEKLKEKGIPTKTGKFGADMEAQILNDGLVTIILNDFVA